MQRVCNKRFVHCKFSKLVDRCPGKRSTVYRCINYKISKAISEQSVVLWIDLGVHVIHLLP